ncbi:hypothetical protein [Arthrobacter sp. SLBN-83]|uniref:hypothetical protein n=1 Tax=Arthrobacter sp. SLBN-83 TaxID=2768449 RepID=UPI001358AC5E|nr:hypothetical protein [Arthrobacter sp. SLBN-83]
MDIARGDSNTEVEAFVRAEAMPVTVDPQQPYELPHRPFVPINEWMEPGEKSPQGKDRH